MGNKPSRIDKRSIDIHNETTAQSKLKIVLFGSNIGKSQWFNGRTDDEFISKIESFITFKIESFTIGDKLPDIKTVIYDTPRNSIYFHDTIKYIPSADGLILTYNIHDIDSLYYLEECIHKIKQTIQKHTPCLLLGIQECTDYKFMISNCVDEAQQFAIKYNLFHLEIDIIQTIDANEPYLYLLRQMLNQKQTIVSPYNHKVNDLRPLSEEPQVEKKPDLMPYTLRAFADDIKHREWDHSLQMKAMSMEPLFDACELKSLIIEMDELDEKVHVAPRKHTIHHRKDTIHHADDDDGDEVCQLEFERFFELSLGSKRSSKYLYQFKAKQYNDIRLIDPDIFDEDWFASGEIKMSLLDKKLFKKEIQKYKIDYVRFENMLCELNMTEKYHKQFVNRGIATFWSLYHHVQCKEDVQEITNNRLDALIIWDKLNAMNAAHKEKEECCQDHVPVMQVEGQNILPSLSMQWVPKDAYVDVGNSSDSSELYTKPN